MKHIKIMMFFPRKEKLYETINDSDHFMMMSHDVLGTPKNTCRNEYAHYVADDRTNYLGVSFTPHGGEHEIMCETFFDGYNALQRRAK